MEDGGSGHEQRRVGVRVLGGIGLLLGQGDVSGLSDEARELSDGDRRAVDREPVHFDLADRGLLGIELLRAHPEPPGRDLDHRATDLDLGHIRVVAERAGCGITSFG